MKGSVPLWWTALYKEHVMRKIAIILGLLAGALRPQAQNIPATINYQGRLTDNTPAQAPVDGPVRMQFEIWADPGGGTGGGRVWREPDADGTGVTVQVTGGIFNYQLGSTVPIPPSVFTSSNSARHLQIIINPGPTGEILSPRQLISATGYANMAQNAGSALTAANAFSAADAMNLGGVPASGYLLADGTAADSARLGGSLASAYQKKLNTPGCPIPQFLTAINPDGSMACGYPSGFNGSLAGEVTGTQSATVVAGVGGLSAASIAAGATLANAATPANNAPGGTLVKRDGSGGFSAGTITAALNGNAASATNAAAVPWGGITAMPAGFADGIDNDSPSPPSGRIPISSAPYVISAPGSYYLTQSLTLASGAAIIIDNIDNVELDLNGNTIMVSAVALGSYPVYIHDANNIHVHNGTIYGGHIGIWIEMNYAEMHKLRLDHLFIKNFGRYGISTVTTGASYLKVIIENNVVHTPSLSCEGAIYLEGVSGGRLSDNLIQVCNGGSGAGIHAGITNTTITRNEIIGFNSFRCIYLAGSNNVISYNHLYQSGIGLDTNGSSYNNLVEYNHFGSNGKGLHLSTTGGNNLWRYNTALNNSSYSYGGNPGQISGGNNCDETGCNR